MKLYKDKTSHGGFTLVDEADLSDIKSALAEYGLVAVPVEPNHGTIREMEIEHQNCESYYMPDHMTAAYHLLVKSAQGDA